MTFFCCKSSIDKKVVMAVTGLMLLGFVIIHMLGNLQVFLGQDQLNAYAQHLEEMPFLLWPARAILLLALIAHMGTAIKLAIENKNARPVRYSHEDTVQASYASRTMVMSGLIIFAFIVFHLLHFTFDKIHPEFCGLLDSKGRDDVYSMVVLSFRDPLISGTYIFAMAVLCFHLSHGVSSLFQSLGLNDERFRKKIKWLGNIVALVIFLGNSSMPLAALLKILQLPKGVS